MIEHTSHKTDMKGPFFPEKYDFFPWPQLVSQEEMAKGITKGIYFNLKVLTHTKQFKNFPSYKNKLGANLRQEP